MWGRFWRCLGYPLLMQPLFTIPGQANAWSVGYLGFAVGVSLVAGSVLRPALGRRPGPRARRPASESVAETAPQPRARMRGRWLLWLGFSMVGSVLLLGTTNEITVNIMALPMLWVGPLGDLPAHLCHCLQR